jgi:hypothetical protein
MERFRTITAIQKALSLDIFMALAYRTGIVISAFYYLNIDAEKKNEENEAWAGLVEEELVYNNNYYLLTYLNLHILLNCNLFLNYIRVKKSLILLHR